MFIETVSFQNHLAPLGAQCEVRNIALLKIRGLRSSVAVGMRVVLTYLTHPTCAPSCGLVLVRGFSWWCFSDESMRTKPRNHTNQESRKETNVQLMSQVSYHQCGWVFVTHHDALAASRITRSNVPGATLRKRLFRFSDTAMLIVGL